MSKLGLIQVFWQGVFICFLGLSTPLMAKDADAVITEQKLMTGLAAMQTLSFDKGLGDVEQLTRQIPSYQLAKMLKADLYAIKAGRLDWIQDAHRQAKAQSLLMEAKVRWQGHHRAETQRGDWESLLSQYVLKTSQEQHLLIVDSLAHRIYVYQHAENGYQEVANFYVTLGQKGTGKQFRGDMKTPIGIYRIEKNVPDENLPELYGVGALTLDYPNSWDQQKRRTGSGIWLHGTPRSTYSRAPLASRGCVVLNNSAMEALLHQYQLPLETPVIITQAESIDSLAMRLEEKAEVLSKINQWLRSQQTYQVDWEKVSVYVYPGETGVYYVRFPTASGEWIEQYWQRQSDQNSPWQLVHESVQKNRSQPPLIRLSASL